METPKETLKRFEGWTRICFEAETEAHDPGIVSRDSCKGEADCSELTLGMELSKIIKEEGWKYMSSYFPCVYLEEVRPDGITVRVRDNHVKIVPDKWTKVIEVGLSYAVGNIYIRLMNEIWTGKIDSRWDVFTQEEYEQIVAAAKGEDAAAKNRLANIYYYGVPRLHIEEDNAEAVRLWREAAALGNAEALTAIGELYLFSKSLPKEERMQGIGWLEQADALGDVNATYHLGSLYNHGEEGLVEADIPRAVPYLDRAAAAGHPRARVMMGVLYFDGDYVEEDLEKAAAIFKEEWNSSDTFTSTWASYALAQMYYNGWGIEENEDWAKILLRHAYELGMKQAKELFEEYFPDESIYR